jgi:hypothetical protein
VPSQQLQAQLQTQHSVDTGNYIKDKHNIKTTATYNNNNNNNKKKKKKKALKEINLPEAGLRPKPSLRKAMIIHRFVLYNLVSKCYTKL